MKFSLFGIRVEIRRRPAVRLEAKPKPPKPSVVKYFSWADEADKWRRRYQWALCAIAILAPFAITGWMRPLEPAVVVAVDCAAEELTIRDLGAEVAGQDRALESAAEEIAGLHGALTACEFPSNFPEDER